MNEKDIKAGDLVRDKIVSAIIRYIDVHQYAPTVREIGRMVGLKSTSSVQEHIKTLINQGRLKSNAEFGSPRSLTVPGYKFVKVAGSKTNDNIKRAITRLSLLLSEIEKQATPRTPLKELRWAIMCGIEALESAYVLVPDEIEGVLHCPVCRHGVGIRINGVKINKEIFCQVCGTEMEWRGEDEQTGSN